MDDLGMRVLKLESQYPKYNGHKDDQIRHRFGMSAITYFQLLDRLIDDPEAEWLDPALIGRLRENRDRCQFQ